MCATTKQSVQQIFVIDIIKCVGQVSFYTIG